MTEKYQGVTVQLALNAYVVPPLNFRMLQGFADEIAIIQSGKPFMADAPTRAAYVDVIWASVTRNYPDVERDQIMDELDITNAQNAVLALLGISGFEKKADAASGGTPLGELTGAASTGT